MAVLHKNGRRIDRGNGIFALTTKVFRTQAEQI